MQEYVCKLIEDLWTLKCKKILTEDEFQEVKTRLLNTIAQ